MRVIRWIALPYAGLILGELSPRSMGVSYLDWSLGLRVGLVVLAGMLALLFVVRIWLYNEESLPAARRSPGPFSLTMWLESSAQEFHWCFLRGAALDLLTSFPAPDQVLQYWSTWLAAGLAIPGVVYHSKGSANRLISAAILLSTTSLFLYTRNFWLSLLLHAGIRAVLQWRQPPSLRQPGPN